uniref:Succinate dehydrogenase assembly factor 4, mitochondrial n=1 Tax=Lygus hesperus TaxID=30085 RepID=A0A0A9WGW5_LYGHE
MSSSRKLYTVMIQRSLASKIDDKGKATKERGPTEDVKKDLKSFKEFKKTPIGKLDEIAGSHPYAEKEPLPEWPDGINPHTGEIGGPRGVEPTRYGDWERKGRVTDF